MLSTAIQPDVVEHLSTGRILARDAKGEHRRAATAELLSGRR
jgi:hypothetical protein